VEQIPAAPVAVSPHDMQIPLQAVAQQNPWAQMPLPHSVPPEQTAPFDLRPHELPLQNLPGAQSASTLQVPLQALAPQANGEQEVEPGVNVVPLGGQVAPAQAVPCWYFSQDPAWHLPSVPQLVPP
jgi:hypothetical protein